MTLTQDFTYQYTDTGVILNTDANPSAPFVDVINITGLDSAPPRETSSAREGQDGGFTDVQFEDMRVIILDGVIYSPQAQIESYLDSLKGNFGLTATTQPFYFYHPTTGQRTIFAKSLGVKYAVDQLRRTGQSPVQFQLRAEDPTIYGASQTLNATIAGASSGRAYNKGYNYGYGGTTSTSGSINCFNGGNKPVKAIFVLTNIINPSIVSDTTGQRLNFNISIQSTDYLTVDLRDKTVVLNGTANRRGTLLGGSQWFLLQPGNNYIRFLGATGAGTPNLSATFRAGYR